MEGADRVSAEFDGTRNALGGADTSEAEGGAELKSLRRAYSERSERLKIKRKRERNGHYEE